MSKIKLELDCEDQNSAYLAGTKIVVAEFVESERFACAKCIHNCHYMNHVGELCLAGTRTDSRNGHWRRCKGEV